MTTPEYLITECPIHGSKSTTDLASARVYIEAAGTDALYRRGGFLNMTPETARRAHEAIHADGSDCWDCCDSMVIDPQNIHIFI